MSDNEVLIPEKNAKFSTSDEVWLRIGAFLELKSDNTQRTYVGIIKEWCEFLGAEAGSKKASELILKASDLHAVAYKKWLEGRPGQKPRIKAREKVTNALSTNVNKKKKIKKDGTQSTLANATLAKKFAALRRIYKMLIGANLGVNQNPFDSDKVPPPAAKSGQKRPTEMIDFSLVKVILSLPDISKPKGVRDLALLSVLFGGGLRRSEVVGIRLGDVRKTPKGTIYLRLRATKSKQDYDQPIPAWASKNVLELIKLREESGAESGDYLFVSFRGKGGLIETTEAISDYGIYNLFKNYCKTAGANKYATPHSARATAITKLLDTGLSHREVQEFSRHASIQMVEVYDKRRIGIDENPAKDLEF